MVFNATFNKISAILWRSVLLVEDPGVSAENHRPVASHWQTLSHVVTKYTSPWADSNSQLQWWYVLIAQVVVNPTTMRSRPWRPHFYLWFCVLKVSSYNRNIMMAVLFIILRITLRRTVQHNLLLLKNITGSDLTFYNIHET